MKKIIFATRSSDLARWQTQWVIKALKKTWPEKEFAEKIIITKGDRILDKPLPEIGGKGLFTLELEQEILDKKVNGAVHSLKDLPVENPPGLTIGAVPERAEVRDALVSKNGHTLDNLPQNARVGTSSLRRAAQLLSYRQDLQIVDLRGNIDTRIRKAYEDNGDYDAIVVAGAGLTRLGLDERISQWLPLEIMLPAPAQGALGIQCRQNDITTLEILSDIEDKNARAVTTAERAFLLGLGGGCAIPVAAYAEVESGYIHLRGLVASLDGKRVIRVEGEGTDAAVLGDKLARKALDQGAGEILDV